MTISEYISGRLNEAVAGIKTNLATKGINASGRTSASIQVVEVESNHWQIVGGGDNCAPIATLEIGRPPGKVPEGFADIIYQWGISKGLGNWSMKGAKAVAWKIRRQGTNRHILPEDVYTSVILTTKDDITKEAAKHITAEVKTELGKVIHNIFKP